MEQRQLEVGYLNRSMGHSKTLRLHSIGLIARSTVSYLIATVGKYQDLRQLVLRRIQRAELLEEPGNEPNNWNIDDYRVPFPLIGWQYLLWRLGYPDPA